MTRLIHLMLALNLISCNSDKKEKSNIDTSDEKINLVHKPQTNQSSPLIKQIENCSDSISLLYGTYFGECIEYCNTELKITSVGIKQTVSSWSFREDLPNLPSKIKAIPFSKSDWKELTKKIDFDKFKILENRIGCPDCDDGGAEWIEIRINKESKRITIENGASIKELNPLLKSIRNLKIN